MVREQASHAHSNGKVNGRPLCAQSGRRQQAVGATHLFLLGRPQGVLSFFLLFFAVGATHLFLMGRPPGVLSFVFLFFAVGATHLFLLGRPQGVLSVFLLY